MTNDPDRADGDTTFKYWAFISYSHADAAWSAWLHKTLERYRVPRQLVGRVTPAGTVTRRLFPIFRDREELEPGASLPERLKTALLRSRSLIVICSPAAAASPYVNREIAEFKQLGRDDRVLCLIVDGEPGAAAAPGSEPRDAFPRALRQRVGADGQLVDDASEPLAADMRPGKDGKRNAALKLLAGVLGVGYDELKQRDRRRRRWRAVQSVALALLVVGITAGIWRYQQAQTNEERIRTEARNLASRSLGVTDKDGPRRFDLVLRSRNLTQAGYGYTLPESEIALYRAITELHLRGVFVEDDTSDDFGGWTWPVTSSRDGGRIAAPSALGPTVILGPEAEKVAVLRDPESPYENDFVAITARDGQHFVTAGNDGVVRIWTMEGRLVRRFRAHAADILSLDQSTDGTMLLTVGCDSEPGYQSCGSRSARVWTLSGAPGATFTHAEANVVSAAFSPTAHRIATAGETGTVRFWLPGGGPLFEVAGSPWVTGDNFGRNGHFVTGGCPPYLHAGMSSPLAPSICPEISRADRTVALYDGQGTLVARLPGWWAAFGPGRRWLVTVAEICERQGQGPCTTRVHLWRPDGTPLNTFRVDSIQSTLCRVLTTSP